MVKVDIETIHFEPLIYPRKPQVGEIKLPSGQTIHTPFWQTTATYKRALRAGAKFPPILLTILKGKTYLVDGLHTLIATIQLKRKTIDADYVKCKNFDEAYIIALQRNNRNGQPLDEAERTEAIIRLRRKGYSTEKIGEVLCITSADIRAIITKRVRLLPNGTEIAIKKPLLRVADRLPADFTGDTQKLLSGNNQSHMLKELILLIENDLLDIDSPDIAELVTKLHYLLSQMIVPMRPGKRRRMA